jgi:VWFA-related protein
MKKSVQMLSCAVLLTNWPVSSICAQTTSSQDEPPAPSNTSTVFKTSVRRVVLDVVVTDAKGAPVPGLRAANFSVTEDGNKQKLLSFDASGFSSEMDYVPPDLPAQPPNTFTDMPSTPEKGPLYVLLYDLVNMDSPDQMNSPEDHSTQMIARKQMVEFIRSKPDGARFAIFVRSDGLHLIQGFTSDKSLLYSAIDPHAPKPHFPPVFLMAPNFGRGDRVSAMGVLHSLASYLDGLPGRKNLIWFSSQFPLSLFASDSDGPNYRAESKATLDLLAHDQIAVYPVDARGVPYQDSHSQLSTSAHSDTVTSAIEAAPASAGGTPSNSPSATSSFVQGSSTVMSSYSVMDEIARETGGRAFYSNNDVAAELVAATRNGGTYYTLTYSPTNRIYDGKLRNIHITVSGNSYQLSYRRFYYATDTPNTDVAMAPPAGSPIAAPHAVPVRVRSPQPAVMDTLSANMQYGAPAAHQLAFIVEAERDGPPVEATPEQMATLATEPAYFKSRRKSAPIKPLPPVPLQRHMFNFEIPTRQFKNESALNLEIAAAAFDADGRMMNAIVNLTRKELEQQPASSDEPRFFRIEQQLDVPVGATSLRVAVRDTTNDRTGAMQINLPLAEVDTNH